MRKFEYMILTISDDEVETDEITKSVIRFDVVPEDTVIFTTKLKELGEEGWEIASMVEQTFFLKREIDSAPQKVVNIIHSGINPVRMEYKK